MPCLVISFSLFFLFFTLLLMLYLCVLYVFIFFFLYIMVNKVATNSPTDLSRCSGPKFTILWGHVREMLLLKFFSDCRYVPWLRRNSPTKLCDGAQMAIFCVIFASCISSEPRAAGFRHAF